MRCEAQIARFWLLRRRVSQSLRAHFQTRKHWGREWVESGMCGRVMRMRAQETYVLPAEAFHSLLDFSFYTEILGSLNNHDKDNDHNLTKQLVLRTKKKALHVHHPF